MISNMRSKAPLLPSDTAFTTIDEKSKTCMIKKKQFAVITASHFCCNLVVKYKDYKLGLTIVEGLMSA